MGHARDGLGFGGTRIGTRPGRIGIRGGQIGLRFGADLDTHPAVTWDCTPCPPSYVAHVIVGEFLIIIITVPERDHRAGLFFELSGIVYFGAAARHFEGISQHSYRPIDR